MKNFIDQVASVVSAAIHTHATDKIENGQWTADEVINHLTEPPNPEMGDLSFPCFPLAKLLRKSPQAIASELAKLIELSGTGLAQVKVDKAYINFVINADALAREILLAVHEQGPAYGTSVLGQGRTVLVDYSSPNIAKTFHIGHLRSTVIGAALYRLMAAMGYKPVGINHLGDWGTQFGMVMAAYSEAPDEKALREDPIGYSLKLYTEFNKRVEDSPEDRDKAKEWFKRLEDRDEQAYSLWQMFRGLSLEEFERLYDRLGIKFDHYTGESFYNDKMEQALTLVEKAGLVEKGDDGAELVRLEGDMPPALLRKSDGATLYLTRDLAAAMYRKDTFDPELMLYVVGTPQSLHFEQLTRVLKMMGCEWADNMVHVKFGHVHGMSTRRGNVIFLSDVIDEAVAKSREKIEENIKDGKLDSDVDVDELSEAVGIGALVASDLKSRREKDVNFDWDQILQFDGETGPYLQYTHARICGILSKSKNRVSPDVDWSLLGEPETRELIKRLGFYPGVIQKAAQEFEPSLITTYLFELASLFNSFYNKHRVLDSGQALEPARLLLVDVVRQVLHNALCILGIKPLDRM